MSQEHLIEYSKSSSAKCKGPKPCKGSSIDKGLLRYGNYVTNQYGDSVEWRHWGCVTPEILLKLGKVVLDRVPGFDALSRDDHAKVRRAIVSRRVAFEDVPESAKLTAVPSIISVSASAAGTSQKKRKAMSDAAAPSSSPQVVPLSSSQPQSSSQAVRQIVKPTGGREVDEEPEEDIIFEEEPRDELYCVMNTKIVGVQYYKGMVGPDEQVMLVREPHNQYDRNAIQVKNISGIQLGHIPRNIATQMAPLMDRGLVTIEGVMHEGNLDAFSYSLSMSLKFYGRSNLRDQLEPLLVWATPRQRGFPARGNNATASQSVPGSAGHSYASGYGAFGASAPSYPTSQVAGPSSQKPGVAGMTLTQIEARNDQIRKQQESLAKAADLRSMLNNLEKVDDEGRRESLLDTLCSTDDILNLPLHPNPPGVENGQLMVDLLKHQSQALQWCIEREYPILPKKEADKPVQFWQVKLKPDKKPYYYNIATKTPQEQPPALGRGALCADSMGLGKTLTMLSLILATQADNSPGFSKTTLIVVPLSVMSNWEKQIEDHCVRGVVSSCVYYGSMRSLTPKDLMKYDIVITTYQTIAGEHADSTVIKTTGEGPMKKKKTVAKGLFDVAWKRIILDEGHNIRNAKTKMAKAVCALNAERRWVLSGTPIINSPQDLGSILTFLQICRPLDNEDFFKRLLLRPLKDGIPAGAELLRALMSHICIRRTKEMQDVDGNHLVSLPPGEMTLVPVQLDDAARKLYDAVEELSKQRLERMMGDNHTINPTISSNVLSMLTRLRQLALHPGLVPSNYLEQLRATEDAEQDDKQPPAIHLAPEDRLRLQCVLAQVVEDNEECPICFSILNEPRITACAHAFCLPCITEVISRDPKCPMDRRPVTMADLIEPAPPTELTHAPIQRYQTKDANDSDTPRHGSSSKIDQLVHLLQLTPATEKSLVFSQFTGFLDKIAEALEENGLPYSRFDGQMSAKRRADCLERFSMPLEDYSHEVGSPGAAKRRTKAAKPSQISKPPRPRSARCTDSHDSHDELMILADDSTSDVDLAADADSGDDVLSDGEANSAFALKARQSKGKAKAKSKGKGREQGKPTAKASAAIRSDLDGTSFGTENPKVMLISLKAGALGLNLTVANNVYLMDPWWQEGIESQAIDRCNRIGQKKPVHVYQMIAENTVEAKVLEIQDKKKNLITQAFSGIKRKETQREKKMARLNDLVELFGIRQQAATQRS